MPTASRHVTSVGGTARSKATSTTRGWTETVWKKSSTEGTGSDCSSYDTKPTWQTDTGRTKRTIPDVSAVADPATGVSVHDSYRHHVRLVHLRRNQPLVPAHRGRLRPGYLRTAQSGYDGPTCWGTPEGVSASTG